MKPEDASLAVNTAEAAAVFAAMRPTLEALPADTVRRGNLPLNIAAENALIAVPHLRAAEERIRQSLPETPPDIATRVEHAALTAYHAHLLFPEPEEKRFADIAPRATELREGFVGVMAGLIKRKRVPATILEDVTPGTGYRDLAEDLGKLAERFRSRWSELENRVDVTPAELDEASRLSTMILRRLAEEGGGALTTPDEVDDIQARAATLLRTVHAQAQQAAAYLFWFDKDGWAQKAPGLMAGVGGGARVVRGVPAGEAEVKPGVEPKPELAPAE